MVLALKGKHVSFSLRREFSLIFFISSLSIYLNDVSWNYFLHLYFELSNSHREVLCRFRLEMYSRSFLDLFMLSNAENYFRRVELDGCIFFLFRHFDYQFVYLQRYFVLWEHLQEFCKRRVNHERRALFERKITWIISSPFFTHLLNEFAVSMHSYFNTRSEIFRCSN